MYPGVCVMCYYTFVVGSRKSGHGPFAMAETRWWRVIVKIQDGTVHRIVEAVVNVQTTRVGRDDNGICLLSNDTFATNQY